MFQLVHGSTRTKSSDPMLRVAETLPIFYDRRVPDALLEVLDIGGAFHSLIERRNQDPLLFDVQLRSTPTSSESWASLYLGLTSILDVVMRGDRFHLRAHQTHRTRGGFDPAWSVPQPLSQLAEAWSEVEGYLTRVVPTVDRHHFHREGRVHAAICSGRTTDYRVLDREAAVRFRNSAVKEAICAPFRDSIRKALAASDIAEDWWPGLRRPLGPLGTGLDILAVDSDGRLLVIEAKPADTTTARISAAPIQVRFYAELFAMWVRCEPDALAVLDGMLAQRVGLGLTATGPNRLPGKPLVVPVIAVGAVGRFNVTAMNRLTQVTEALNDEPPVEAGIAPPEVWQLDQIGNHLEIPIGSLSSIDLDLP